MSIVVRGYNPEALQECIGRDRRCLKALQVSNWTEAFQLFQSRFGYLALVLVMSACNQSPCFLFFLIIFVQRPPAPMRVAHTHTHTRTQHLSHNISLSHALAHTHTHSLTHTDTHTTSLTQYLSHTHTHTLSLSLSLLLLPVPTKRN